MLIVLSLPMLIVSLFQLESYQQNLNEQAATIARIKAIAAGSALDTWLENRPAAVAQGASLAPREASELYARLRRHASPDADAAVLVFDAKGQLVPEPSAPSISHVPSHSAADVHQEKWSDNVERLTSERQSARYGWSVAVGVPLAENTPAGRGFLVLTSAWALGLTASSFLSFWAVGRFTTPLRRLAASVSTLGQGQLHERFEVETDDEVGTLAAGFNVMAASLETKFNELRTQGAFIEEVLDSLPLGVAVLDSGLIVRKANSTFARIVGREPLSLAGRGVYEAAAGLAVLSEVVEDVRRTRRAFVNYGLPLELVSRTTTGDARNERDEGAKYWDVILWPMSERSEERGDMLLILSEVSKRVRAEKLATAAFAAEKSRAAELESVINQMDEGVIIVDARGRYRVNPAAARIIGRKPGEFRDGVDALIADMALRDAEGHVLPAEDTPLGRALTRGEHVSGEHVQIVRGANEEGVLAVSATPLVGEGGGREGVVAVFRDITPEVRQYKELMGAYGRLREHDRLKSAFVANVSHELRTPLNVIIGLCQLLERDRRQPLAPLQSEAVERMGRNARSLLELVNDLLDYSRLEAGRSALHLEEIEVAGVIEDVIKGFDAEVTEKHVRLEAEVSPALGAVKTDRHKLSQVLTNLVSNAVKFTATGTIRVVAAPLDGTHWFMEVSDTGIGISREALSFIFDEFRQVDDRLTRPYSGVGLGLAITRKIVELLEGEITVESRPNEGSHFRIVWPLNAQPRTGTGSLIKDAATHVAPGHERPTTGDLRLERQNLRTRTG
jgi:signal transduction histidine kinase/HAMP domain-containing protein